MSNELRIRATAVLTVPSCGGIAEAQITLGVNEEYEGASPVLLTINHSGGTISNKPMIRVGATHKWQYDLSAHSLSGFCNFQAVIKIKTTFTLLSDVNTPSVMKVCP